MAVRRRSGYLKIATEIFIHEFWQSCTIRRMNESALPGTLYTKGLTPKQVGEVFQDIYGEYYSKTNISRMLDSFVRMSLNGLRTLWRSIIRSPSSIAYT